MNEKNKITESCKKCGNVEFKIESLCGGLYLICLKCNKKIQIDCQPYSSVKRKCLCGSEVFKAKKDVENYYDIRCARCNNDVEDIFVNKNLDEISESEADKLRKRKLLKCNKCGTSDFILESKHGEVKYICKKCDSEINDYSYDKYTKLLTKCECGNNIFEVEIKKDSYHVREYFPPKCIVCGNNTKEIYIDDNNNRIDKITKEILILNDKINEFKNDLSNLKQKIYCIDEEVVSQYYSISDVKNRMKSLESDINSLEYKFRD